MTLLPKGVYRQRKKLADGTARTYYRWRATGARIEGEPGTPEFEASLSRAKGAPRSTATAGTIAALIQDYRRSPNYRSLRPNSAKYYDRALARIRPMEHRPVAELKRADVLAIRDAIAVAAPQSANQFVMVMSCVLDFAVDRGLREINPLVRIRRIKGGTHATWNEAQIKYALANLPERLRRAVILALYSASARGTAARCNGPSTMAAPSL